MPPILTKFRLRSFSGQTVEDGESEVLGDVKGGGAGGVRGRGAGCHRKIIEFGAQGTGS